MNFMNTNQCIYNTLIYEIQTIIILLTKYTCNSQKISPQFTDMTKVGSAPGPKYLKSSWNMIFLFTHLVYNTVQIKGYFTLVCIIVIEQQSHWLYDHWKTWLLKKAISHATPTECSHIHHKQWVQQNDMSNFFLCGKNRLGQITNGVFTVTQPTWN